MPDPSGLSATETAFLDGIRNNTLFDDKDELKTEFHGLVTENKAFREAVVKLLNEKLEEENPDNDDNETIFKIVAAIAKHEKQEKGAFPLRSTNMLINDTYMVLAKKFSLSLSSFLPTDTENEETNKHNQIIQDYIQSRTIDKPALKEKNEDVIGAYLANPSAPQLHAPHLISYQAGLNKIAETMKERYSPTQNAQFYHVFLSGLNTKLKGQSLSFSQSLPLPATTAKPLMESSTLEDKELENLSSSDLKNLAEKMEIRNPFMRLFSPMTTTQLNVAVKNTLRFSEKNDLPPSHKKYLYEVLENLKKEEESSPLSKIRKFFMKLFGGKSFAEKQAEFVKEAKTVLASPHHQPTNTVHRIVNPDLQQERVSQAAPSLIATHGHDSPRPCDEEPHPHQ